MKALVEVELENLGIKVENISKWGFPRVPTWMELFVTIDDQVRAIPPGLVEKGPFVFVVPEGEDGQLGGKCAVYAGFVWAMLQMLVKNRVGINVGGVRMKLYGGPKGEGALCIPADVKCPNPLQGGYHAWCMMERHPNMKEHTEDDTLLIDFGYHWFQLAMRNCAPEQIVGPKKFIVAKPLHLASEGIGYHAHDALSEQFTNALKLEDYFEELPIMIERLRELATGPRLGRTSHPNGIRA